jgi:hypothetical protein
MISELGHRLGSLVPSFPCSEHANGSRPMPKARSHIAALAEQHEKQSQKIEELERLIAEVHPASNISRT